MLAAALAERLPMPEVAAASRFVAVADVAERLALDPSSVLALIRSGALPAVDVALPGTTRRRWRIAAVDLDAFLAARRSSPPSRRKNRRRSAEREAAYY
jgi:hypothetical protein